MRYKIIVLAQIPYFFTNLMTFRPNFGPFFFTFNGLIFGYYDFLVIVGGSEIILGTKKAVWQPLKWLKTALKWS